MNRRTFLTATGVTAASVALAGCNEFGSDDDGDDDDDLDFENVEEEPGVSPDSLELTSSAMVETSRGVAVMGTVENTGDTDYAFVEVEAMLKDGDTVIGEWGDTSEQELDGLAAGEVWRFMGTFDGEEMYEATGYRVDIDGDLAN